MLTYSLSPSNRNLKIGYFSQHHVDQLDLNVCLVELLLNKFPGTPPTVSLTTVSLTTVSLTTVSLSLLFTADCVLFAGRNEEEYRHQLGGYGITGELATRPVASLSGGQKSRVAFAQMTMPW